MLSRPAGIQKKFPFPNFPACSLNLWTFRNSSSHLILLRFFCFIWRKTNFEFACLPSAHKTLFSCRELPLNRLTLLLHLILSFLFSFYDLFILPFICHFISPIVICAYFKTWLFIFWLRWPRGYRMRFFSTEFVWINKTKLLHWTCCAGFRNLFMHILLS